MDLDDTINASYAALDAFAKGDPAAVKLLFSHRDDVMLANPFGPAVAGWSAASQMLDFASSRFRNGHVSGVDRVARYEASDLAVSMRQSIGTPRSRDARIYWPSIFE